MKIIQLTINPSGGGAERVSMRIHKEILGAGYISKMVCIDSNGIEELQNKLDITILNKNRLTGIRRIIESVKQLKKILNEFKPDILHVHCESPELVAFLSNWSKYSRHLVVTEHTERPWYHAKLLGIVVRRFSPNRRAKYSSCADFGKTIYFNSSKAKIINNYQRDLSELPNIEDSCLFKRIVIIQRLFPLKRTMMLLEVMLNIEQKIPVIVIGSGPEIINLQEFSMKNGLLVKFTGHVENPWSFVQSGDLYVSCSSYEGNPLSVTEASIARMPMLLSDIPAHRKLVETEFQIFKTPNELFYKIDNLVKKKKTLMKFQNSIRFTEEIQNEYSSKNLTKEWLTFYENL